MLQSVNVLGVDLCCCNDATRLNLLYRLSCAHRLQRVRNASAPVLVVHPVAAGHCHHDLDDAARERQDIGGLGVGSRDMAVSELRQDPFAGALRGTAFLDPADDTIRIPLRAIFPVEGTFNYRALIRNRVRSISLFLEP